MAVEPRIPLARILGTGSYLPAVTVAGAALERERPAREAATEATTPRLAAGRRCAPEGMRTSDMAAAAGQAALTAAGLGATDLDMIIVATTSGDSPMPATAVFVQQKLGASHIPSFDLAASFAGFVFGLSVANQFISAGALRHVLIIGADMLSHLADPDERPAPLPFGDGAGALLLGPAVGDGRGVLCATMRADGRLADQVKIQGGGSAEPMTAERLAAGRHYLRVDGPELFLATVQRLGRQVDEALKAAGLSIAELDWIVPHRANPDLVSRLSEQLGYPRHKFIESPMDVGNTGAGAIPIALDEALRNGGVLPGQSALLCALGGGVAWGAAVVRV